jgi:hypothetical protein
MIMIKKGEPLEVSVGFKSTTKAKYDEFYSDNAEAEEDTAPWGDSDTTPGDDSGYDEDPITMEDVRAKCVALDKATQKGEAKKILIALGVNSLSDLDEDDYPKAINMIDAALKKAGK